MMLDLLLLVLLIVVIGVLLYLASMVFKLQLAQNQSQSTIDTDLKSISDRQTREFHLFQSNLQNTYHHINNRLDQASNMIGELKREAGAIGEVTRSIHSLELYLKHPKSRGNIGERILKDLVSQLLPKSQYQMQYPLKSGSIVDLAIFTRGGTLPVDSKFPSENFQKYHDAKQDDERLMYQKLFLKDVKLHLNSIASKYISPSDGTVDFALMYIPSETVYYDVISSDELLTESHKLRVFLVSPNTFYLHLQSILLSLESHKLASHSTAILQAMRGLNQDFLKLIKAQSTLHKHLQNAFNISQGVSTMIDALKYRLDQTKQIHDTKPDQSELDS
jgi:DNA recombination protein RmuC